MPGEPEWHRDVLLAVRLGTRLKVWKTIPDRGAPVFEHRSSVESGHVDVADADAAGFRRQQPGDRRQERRLAAAARSVEQDEFAGTDVEVEVIDGSDELTTALVGDGELADGELVERS